MTIDVSLKEYVINGLGLLLFILSVQIPLYFNGMIK